MNNIITLPSFTSRTMREGEEEGVQYHFISKEEFEDKIRKGDFYEYGLKKGETVLMCTDGLSTMVEDTEILHIVKGARDIVEAVEELINKANENGGKDNIGIVAVDAFADEVKL